MQVGQLKFSKIALSKWLLALTLVLTFFALSDNIAQSSFPAKKTESEVVLSSRARTSSPTIVFYTKAIGVATANLYPAFACSSSVSSLSIASCKVKIDHLSSQFDSIKIAFRFRQLKTIPQSSDEDMISPSLG